MEIHLSRTNLDGKHVILRLDLDVPLTATGPVADLTRLQAARPSLKHCLKYADKTLVLGHLGRPDHPDPQFSLKPALNELKKLLHQDISLITTPGRLGDWRQSSARLGLLENLRFWSGEDANDPQFTASLAAAGDVYINDAFAVSHRLSASIIGLPRLLPSFIGYQFAREVAGLQQAFHHPQRPVIMVIGGIKADKLQYVDNFINLVDKLLIGGRLVDHSPDHPKILNARLNPDKLDVTPQSAKLFADQIATSGTVVWNGPLGQFERPQSASGTRLLAQAIVQAGHRPGSPAYTIVGGGDTLSAIHQFGFKDDQFSHVSLGGGAMLYFLAHRTLPGLEAILNHPRLD